MPHQWQRKPKKGRCSSCKTNLTGLTSYVCLWCKRTVRRAVENCCFLRGRRKTRNGTWFSPLLCAEQLMFTCQVHSFCRSTCPLECDLGVYAVSILAVSRQRHPPSDFFLLFISLPLDLSFCSSSFLSLSLPFCLKQEELTRDRKSSASTFTHSALCSLLCSLSTWWPPTSHTWRGSSSE